MFKKGFFPYKKNEGNFRKIEEIEHNKRFGVVKIYCHDSG